MQQAIELTTTVVRSPEQVSGTLGAEAVLLSIEDGKYYSMSPMGTQIWERLDSPVQVQRLVDGLLEEFDVERTRCEAEVLGFLSQLYDRHLVRIEQ